MEIAVVADPHVATAFRLAGIKRTYETGNSQQRLAALLQDDDIGLIIITESLADECRSLIDQQRASPRMLPLIVEVPDFSGPKRSRIDDMSRIIKRALGMDGI